MNDDIDMFLDKADGNCYVESLIKSRQFLRDTALMHKLDAVIEAVLELAHMRAEKAKSEILKSNKNNVLKPIK